MPQKGETNGVRPSDSDRRRLESDRVEIAKRLTSLTRTIATTLGLDEFVPDRIVVSVRPAQGGSGEIVDIEIPWIEIRSPDGTVVCHQDPPGVCCRKPCPCQ